MGLRTWFRVSEVVAPDAALARAMTLWCTPPRAVVRHDNRPGPGDVVRLAVPRGGEVTAEVWGDGPVVYLVHGWGGWRGQLGAFVSPLVAAGRRVVAIDAPGHGDADPSYLGPNRGTFMEFGEALAAAVSAFGPPAGLVGHSMGSMVVADAVRAGVAAERVVLISAADSFHAHTHTFASLLGISDRLRRRMLVELAAMTGRSVAEFDLVPITAMPATLVVHDRADGETPFATAAAISERWPDARLLATQGLGHYRILADDAVVTAAIEHLTGR